MNIPISNGMESDNAEINRLGEIEFFCLRFCIGSKCNAVCNIIAISKKYDKQCINAEGKKTESQDFPGPDGKIHVHLTGFLSPQRYETSLFFIRRSV
jgi:hypothetical protein